MTHQILKEIVTVHSGFEEQEEEEEPKTQFSVNVVPVAVLHPLPSTEHIIAFPLKD
jgi:hypothetical protein